MPWFRSTGNEMGDYLPDDEATLLQGQDTVKGKNKDEAQESCADLASEYNAISSDVEETEDDDTWICKFKFWG